MNPDMSPLGAVFAVLFFGAILGIVGAMLESQAIRSAQTDRGRSAPSSRNNILVPLTMGTDVRAAANLACQVGAECGATIILAYVMDLPSTLSLQAELPEWEADAERALRAGEFIVRQHRMCVECRIVRHRTIAGAVLDLVRKTGAREIVVTTHQTPRRFFARVDPTVTDLLRRAPCQVIVAELPAHAL